MLRAVRGRALRARAVVWAAWASVVTALTGPAAATPVDQVTPAGDVWQGGRHPVWLTSGDASEAPIVVYPPSVGSKAPARLLMLLHGMCGHPENECPSLAGEATRDRFVACPRADLACEGTGAIWSGSSKLRNAKVAEARARVARAFPGQVAEEEATLVGFSLGSFVALDVAEHTPGAWPHVVLVGAKVSPDLRLLRKSGVESVLFASGDWDMSRQSMRASARSLSRSGFHATYVGMGPIGHWFARDMDAWLPPALAWGEGGGAVSALQGASQVAEPSG